MSRVLKFRYWDGAISSMVYSDDFGTLMPNDEHSQIQTLVGFFEKARYYASPNQQYAYLNDENTIMQYTGLKDKFGNEIYEGDVVQASIGDRKFVGKVRWMSRSDNYDYSGWNCFPAFFPLGENPDSSYDCVKLGNLYENPELLEKLT